MTESPNSSFRANIDAVALALIVLFSVPVEALPQPAPELIAAANRPAQALTEKGERVWRRLEQKMQRFEQRFDRLAAPCSRGASRSGAVSRQLRFPV
ncbi:MAG: hypothetical protein HZB13_12540 [Acidobacteria bacterium]|nr:hypothetical protein [Acidobacteriota bacterium]